MKRALITIMLAALVAGIPVFAGARNLEHRIGANTVAATYSPEPATPQYRRRYYRRRYRRRRYFARRRYYPRHYRRIYYRRRRY
jgi:hypothetical protein